MQLEVSSQLFHMINQVAKPLRKDYCKSYTAEFFLVFSLSSSVIWLMSFAYDGF